jgi:sugar/nucleoside kinase (ribokinase family)
MWLIDSKTFLSDHLTILHAQDELLEAQRQSSLSIVVGNSFTQFSAFLSNEGKHSPESPHIGWERAVRTALDLLLAPEKDSLPLDTDPNVALFVIAQAICAQYKEARSSIIEQLNLELLSPLAPSPLHQLLLDLQPKSIVTTNYDLQLERAAATGQRDWEAIVADATQQRDKTMPIYKINGSLKPDSASKANYTFPQDVVADVADQTVVIAGVDFEERTMQLTRPLHPVVNVLGQTLLIAGKSLNPLDTAFMSVLHRSRQSGCPVYYLTYGLSPQEALYAKSHHIVPLIINMPRRVTHAHYYVGMAYALMRLFPEVGTKYAQEIGNYVEAHQLIRSPRFIAIGLTAHNTIGRLRYKGNAGEESFVLPTQGRRNFGFEAEEYPGGAALTAVKTFVELDRTAQHPTSIISILNASDLFGEEIFQFCDNCGIDADGISQNAEHTWHSTVLVHDGISHKGVYPGQRIFMDRSFTRLQLDKTSLEQLAAQLSPYQRNLRLVYFDKFLAQPYNAEDNSAVGALVQHQEIIRELVNKRADVDILYETGGGGSRGLIVENALNSYINVLTAAFPFFARNVLPPNDKKAGELAKYARDDFFITAEFENETQAIEELLHLCASPGEWFRVPLDWLKNGRTWAGRPNGRRWLITTLHHYGALAIDLNIGEGIYCKPTNTFDAESVESTVGAGDVFRGAFSYALVQLGEGANRRNAYESRRLMYTCTQFAVEVASEKCRYFKMSDAFSNIHNLRDEGLLETIQQRVNT